MPSDPIANQFPDDADYTNSTFPQDSAYLKTLIQIPPQSGNGGYVADNSNAKREYAILNESEIEKALLFDMKNAGVDDGHLQFAFVKVLDILGNDVAVQDDVL